MEQSRTIIMGNIMDQSRTLWMGNIENWMNENYINQILTSLNLKPIKIRILQNDNPKSCCFIEFESPETADFVLEKYNGLKLNDLILKLKRVISKKKDNNNNLIKEQNDNNKKYTIYVGNIPKDINNEQLKNFFKHEFPSVVSSKIIFDSLTKISKGFGFIDFSNIFDYQKALNSKNPRILKGNLLTIK